MSKTSNSNQWDILRKYIAVLESNIGTWQKFVTSEFASEYFEVEMVSQWLVRVRTTMQLLRNEYMYDTMRLLGVCPVGSGFPEGLHVRQLTQLRNEVSLAPSLVPESVLRRSCLDQMFQQGSWNYWNLERVSKARVREVMQTVQPISLFSLLNLEAVGTVHGRTLYQCSFERYCYRNIPSLYVMVFECSEDGGASESTLTELLQILEEETSQLPLLGSLAQKVDQAHALIHPKWVGRMAFGPVFISGLTKDTHELQTAIDELYTTGEFGSVSRIIYEYVLAEKVEPVARLYDSVGRKHTELQEFAIRQFDSECAARKVTNVEKHLFAPHAVVQMLSDTFRREINHMIQLQGE